MTARLFYRCDTLDEVGNSDAPTAIDGERVACEESEANLVSSHCDDGQHMPCIDIDLPCRLVPTSTEGHFHLYIDVPMSWDDYKGILIAMATAGVVGPRYLEHALRRGQTFCRPPGVHKPKREPNADAV